MPTCQTVSLLLPLAHHLCSAHEYVTDTCVTHVIKSTMTPTTRRKKERFFLPPQRYLIYCMVAPLCNVFYICLTCETFLVQGQEERHKAHCGQPNQVCSPTHWSGDERNVYSISWYIYPSEM